MSKCLLDKLSDFSDDMEDVEIIKATEGYGYSYADLDSITKAIRPVLKKHKIGYFHKTDYDDASGNNVVITTVYDKENKNDTIVSRTIIDRNVKLAKMNQFMVEGSAITYFRRYHIVAMFGLLADEDTDAGGKREKGAKDVKGAGRSVAAPANNTGAIDYIAIFKNLIEKKPKPQLLKTYDLYKKQLSNEDIKEIDKLIAEKYDN